MKTESIWKIGAEPPRFEPLRGDLKTDILVIGGGMAGVLCAWRLTQAGADCVLAEADRIGGGVTQNTTAKITCQHGLIYDKLIRRFGLEKARLYLAANRAALEEYRALCQTVDCEFEPKDSVVYSTKDRGKIEAELKALARLGAEARLEEAPPLPFSAAGAAVLPNQAQFHPLKFLYALAPKLRIFEQTKVRQLAPGWAETSGGVIRAEQIVVATHFPILNKHGGYFLKLYQSRSYELALKNGPDLGGMYVDEDPQGLSFRNAGQNLLLGGGGGRTGKPGGGWASLEEKARRYYPEAEPLCRWAAQDCMTLDGVPYIGRYSRRAAGLYVATGFNKWGMTGSMAAAMLHSDLLLGRDNDFAPVFSPSRSMLRPQLAVNAWEAVSSLLRPGPRCPHMGCALRYNKQEHSWDCPCHGSRFDEQGALLDNPATDDKKGM